jgi:protein-tyrosine-phosphatase
MDDSIGNSMASILIIGGADTGRAPMAAALLRQLMSRHGYAWPAGSAGVLGHDGDPAEVEARDTMAHMGLSIDEHHARSLTPELVGEAALLLALDKGAALVVRARFPEAAARTHTLGELAGRQRDIPDPFRMQIGAWITYAREIAALLETALPRIAGLLAPSAAEQRAENKEQPGDEQSTANSGRHAAVERIDRLLRTAAEMPGVVDWAAARSRVAADLDEIAALASGAGGLAAGYVGLMHAALTMTPATPTPGQLAALRAAVGSLAGPIAQADLNALSARLGGWAAL